MQEKDRSSDYSENIFKSMVRLFTHFLCSTYIYVSQRRKIFYESLNWMKHWRKLLISSGEVISCLHIYIHTYVIWIQFFNWSRNKHYSLISYCIFLPIRLAEKMKWVAETKKFFHIKRKSNGFNDNLSSSIAKHASEVDSSSRYVIASWNSFTLSISCFHLL